MRRKLMCYNITDVELERLSNEKITNSLIIEINAPSIEYLSRIGSSIQVSFCRRVLGEDIHYLLNEHTPLIHHGPFCSCWNFSLSYEIGSRRWYSQKPTISFEHRVDFGELQSSYTCMPCMVTIVDTDPHFISGFPALDRFRLSWCSSDGKKAITLSVHPLDV